MNNLFALIVADGKKLDADFVAAYKKLFGKAPADIAAVQVAVNEAAPLVEEIATLAGQGTQTTAAVDLLKTALAALEAGATNLSKASSVPTALAAVQASLPAVLSAAKVDNLSTVTQIETAVSTVSTQINAVSAVVSSTAAVVSAAAKPATA